MEKIKRYAALIIVSAIILLAVGVYFLWIPKYNEYKFKLNTLKLRSGEFENKTTRLAELEAKISALSDYQEQIAKIDAAIPVYDFSEVTLLAFVQKIGSENGLIVTNMAVSSKDNNSANSGGQAGWNIKNLSINVSVKGSYASLKNFLNALYLNSRMINVNSIDFASAEKDEYDISLQLDAKHYIWAAASVAE